MYVLKMDILLYHVYAIFYIVRIYDYIRGAQRLSAIFNAAKLAEGQQIKFTHLTLFPIKILIKDKMQK